MKQVVFRVCVKIVLTVVTISLLSGCGGTGDDASESVATGCDSLQFSSTEVLAFKTIRASNLSGLFLTTAADENNQLSIRYISTDSARPLELLLPLFPSLDEGALVLDAVVPVHPENPFVSSKWQTRLIAGDQLCNGPELTAAPLARVETETLDTLALQLKDWLTLRAQAYRIANWEELVQRTNDFVTNGTDASLGLLQLYMATEYANVFLDKLDQASVSDRALMAALFAASGYGSLLQQRIDQLTASPLADESQAESIFSVPAARYARKDGDVCAAITGEPVFIANAGRLSDYMIRQSEVENDLKSNFGKAEEATLALAPFVALASGPVGAGIAAFVFVDKTVREYDSNALPAYFTRLDVDLNPGSEVPEDYELVPGNELKWQNAQAYASSNGMNLSGPTLEVLMMGVGAFRTASTVGNAFNFYTNAEGVIQGQFEGEVFNKIKQKLNFDCLEVKPHTWGPINVTDEQWTEDTLSGSALTLGARLPVFRALTLAQIGSSELTVSMITQKFGGEAFNTKKSINVNRISLVANPARINVQTPGQHESVSVFVVNSAQADLSPTVAASTGLIPDTAAMQAAGAGQFTLGFTTPTAINDYPASITFTREAVLPPLEPRSARLDVVSAEEITLRPAASCVLAGSSKTLTATLTGFAPNTTLNWRILSGVGALSSITVNGAEHTADYSSSVNGAAVIEVSALASNGTNVIRQVADITVGGCIDLYVTGDYQFNVRAINSTDAFLIGEESLLPAPAVPDLPPFYWRNRSQNYATSALSVSDTTQAFGGSLTLGASGNGDVSFAVDADGNAEFNSNMLNASDQCADTGDADLPVVCSTTDSGSSVQLGYYINVNAAQQYDLSISATCSRSGSSYGVLVPVGAFIFRFTGGVGEPGPANPVNFDINNPPDLTGLTPAEISALLGGPPYLENTLVPFINAGNICSSTNGGATTVHEVISLAAPTAAGTTDLVYFTLQFLTLSGMNHYAGYDMSDYLLDGLFLTAAGNIEALGASLTAGNYTGSANMGVTVSLVPKPN